MDNKKAKEVIDEKGFVIIRQFLLADELSELRKNLDRFIRDAVPLLPDNKVFYQDRDRPETLKQMQLQGDAFFDGYPNRAVWRDLAETLLDEPVEVETPAWFNKPPGTEHPTPPHQDNYYFCLEPANVLTMWLALDVVDEENGCLRYIPESHRHGIRPHGVTDVLGFSQSITDYVDADASSEVVVKMRPGDLAVHYGNTIHRADPNRSATRHRRSFAIVFKGESCRRDEKRREIYLASAQQQHKAKGLENA